ncbi:MAG TPA: DUF6125 family protein [Spirochaetota bacterium]|nr:DUF6125 family protein [Spirochaetota bacterium]HPI88022.1 DUF6125 family protein [Spirochaetota bacterium]HPR46732.1 DUF6125 family protein [Spirochaetota bacterium]
MDLTRDQLFELAQYSFTRLDGAWFIGVAQKFGIEAAWEADVAAWTGFAYRFGKRVRQEHIPEPVWPGSYIDAIKLLSEVLKITGREVILDGSRIIVRVTDCETQKMIAKAGIADCGIVTVHTYRELFRGLFGKDRNIQVEHRKNLNRGDDCCEVVIHAPDM